MTRSDDHYRDAADYFQKSICGRAVRSDGLAIFQTASDQDEISWAILKAERSFCHDTLSADMRMRFWAGRKDR